MAYCRDDDFLRVYNGTAWRSLPRSILKTTQETRNADGAVMTADTDLVMALLASTWYRFHVICQFNTQAASDFKCDMNYTGTTTTYREHALYVVPGSTAVVSTTPHTTIGTDTAITGINAGEGWVQLYGAIATNSAGTLQFRWAQNTSDASNTIVRNGSSLTVWRE